MRKAISPTLLACAAAFGALALAGSAAAQDGGNNYAGSPPWNFRSDSERATRTNQAVATVAVRNGAAASAFGGGFGGGFGPASTAVGNNFTVNNTVNCYSGAGAVGSPVTCSGGTNTVTGNTQTNSGNQSADTTTTGNTITNRNTQNNASGPGGVVNGGPN